MAPDPASERPVLGLAIGIVGCTATAVSYTLQKLAHIRTARNSAAMPHLRFQYWRRWEFIVSCLLLVFSSASATVTFTMVSASELAPLGAVTLAVQEVLSYFWLQEPFTRVDGAAVLLMTAGTTIAIGNARSSNQEMTLDVIVALFLRPVALLSVVGASIVLLALSSFVAAVGSAHGAALPASAANLDALSRSVIAGLLGGCTTTLGKAAATVLFLPLFRMDWASLARVEPWLCATALAAATTYQLRCERGLRFRRLASFRTLSPPLFPYPPDLNSGLGRYDSLRIIP